jgi:type IV pilus assembly protein PilA
MMKVFSRPRGFTLIELLVVIAIIGVLSAVVITALNSTRAKANDAATQENLDGARTQGALYFDDNGSYTGVCNTIPDPNGVITINSMLVAARTSSNSTGAPLNTNLATAGSATGVTCHENGTNWAAEAPLSLSSTSAPVMWCVDNATNAKRETTNLAANAVVCN